MLFCDACDKGYHMDCHNPPVEEKPTGKGQFTGLSFGLENLEKWEGIFQSGKSQGILNRLEKSGKSTQNTGKLWKFHL